MTDEAGREQQIRRVIESGLDGQDETVLRANFADDVHLIERDASIPVDDIITSLQTYYETFPDLRHRIHDVLVDGDTVVVHYTNVGTFEAPFTIEEGPMEGLCVEPTGEEIEYFGVYLARFDDGEIVEWMNYPERLRVLQQVGALPTDYEEQR